MVTEQDDYIPSRGMAGQFNNDLNSSIGLSRYEIGQEKRMAKCNMDSPPGIGCSYRNALMVLHSESLRSRPYFMLLGLRFRCEGADDSGFLQ